MSYIIVGVICLVVGFIAGALVYRKNAAKAAKIEEVIK